MRKVIETVIPVDQTPLNNVKKSKYYGVIKGVVGAFITSETYQNTFTLRALDGFTYANGWTGYTSKNLYIVIESLIRDGYEVFEFDTHREFFLWLADQKA